MKISTSLSTILFLVFFSLQAFSQTTAMDFTQDECEGNPHHLYTELDAGKVVILEYVMLNCAPCILGTQALESITKPYQSSHPGRVQIYSFGFLNSYTCEQITAWKNDQEFSHAVFNNGEEQVAYYGGMGMPTIVVVGTNEHKVFYKSIGYLPSMDDAIRAALDSALLYNPTGVYEIISRDRLHVYPTVFSDRIHIEAGKELAGSEVQIIDTFGKVVLSGELPGSGSLALASGNLSKGVYFARIVGIKGISEGVKLIRN
jgi:hypothetical protein